MTTAERAITTDRLRKARIGVSLLFLANGAMLANIVPRLPEIKANHLLVKNVDVIGFYWGGYLKFAPEALHASLETLFGWYAEGGLRPEISHVLPLERVAEGFELLRGRRASGKIVVTP